MKTQRAFTLIETLVAIAILMVAIAGPLTIVNKSLRLAVISRNQMIADYLAQDAMEMIKNIRDNNYLITAASGGGTPTWPPTSLATCVSANCKIDTVTNGGPTVTSVSGSNSELYLYGGSQFTHASAGNIDSGFARQFTLLPVSGSTDEYTVVVNVSWLEGGTVLYETLRGSIVNALR